jgi:copper chaperone CopZ
MTVKIAVILAAVLAPIAVLGALHAGASRGASLQTVTLRIEGMTCGGCTAGIEAALKRVKGVHSAEVSFDRREAQITFDATTVTESMLVATIKDVGYAASKVSCGGGGAPGAPPADHGLSDQDLARVVHYVSERMLTSEVTPTPAELGAEVQAKLGIAVPRADFGRVKEGVVRELRKSPAGLAKLVPSRCDQYGACSLHGDLTGATGPALAMYEREKAEDGRSQKGLTLPEFAAHDLKGAEVSSRSLRGKPTLLVQLAGHCDHSIASLPILQSLRRRYGPEGLRVVGVFVNSGSVADINTWVPRYKLDFDVWVYEDPSLGDKIGSHLTPTYLYVDAQGRLLEKLVGFKSEDEVTSRVASLLAKNERRPGGRVR